MTSYTAAVSVMVDCSTGEESQPGGWISSWKKDIYTVECAYPCGSYDVDRRARAHNTTGAHGRPHSLCTAVT